MQQSFLKLLPGADSIGARLALLVLVCLLLSLVLGLLALLEVMNLAPVDLSGRAFFWIVSSFALTLVILTIILWIAINNDVLKPLEQIRALAIEEEAKSNSLGSVAATIKEMRDSIERTQAELDESHKNLRQIEKLALVGKLAAGVAHSVRNPLTSVNLRLFSLSRGLDLSSRQQEDFQVIADAIQHIDTILTNFLEFSRRPKLKPVTIPPASIVDSSLKLLDNKIASFPVKVTRKTHGVLPDIYGDPDQLREALLNLLLNACEAMEYNGKIDIIEYVDVRQDIPFVHISVQDNGPGMDSDVLAEVFVPFFSTKEQGTGLGLPIAKGICEEHGGDIFVYSSLGVGTRFVIVIPVQMY